MRFPYPTYRVGQRECVERIANSIVGERGLLFNAPTGFGKTVTALCACIEAGAEKIIYTVRTRNEIDPPLREAHRLGLDAAFFISKKLLCPLLSDWRRLGVEDFWENCRLLRKRGKCKYCNKAFQISLDSLKRGFVEGRGRAFKIVSELRELGVCPFYSMKRLAADNPLIVVTYPYVFDPYIYEATLGEIRLEEAVLIVDEAHSLINAADMAERRLSCRKMGFAIRELEEYLPEESELRSRLVELKSLVENVSVDRGYKYAEKNVILDILGEFDEWFDAARVIRELKSLRAVGVEEAIRIRVHTLSIALFTFLLESEYYEAFYVETRGGTALTVKPVDPAIVVSPPLNNSKSVILMSGTLPPKSFFEEVLGLNRVIDELDVEREYSPVFPLENRATIVLTYVTSKFTKRTEEMYEKYARIVVDARRLLPHVILAVYPSYDFMWKILKKVPEELIGVVEEEHTRISDVVEEALEEKNILINAVAGGKLCEGVEIVDPETKLSMIRTVILAGLPYPQPDDYLEKVLEKISSRISRERAWEHLFRETAAVRARQALGRAIRSERDRALYILADNRFMDPKIRHLIGERYGRIIVNHVKYVDTLRRISTELI